MTNGKITMANQNDWNGAAGKPVLHRQLPPGPELLHRRL